MVTVNELTILCSPMHARLRGLAGRYDNHRLEITLSFSHGSMDSATDLPMTVDIAWLSLGYEDDIYLLAKLGQAALIIFIILAVVIILFLLVTCCMAGRRK
jgi:hypothetical protein